MHHQERDYLKGERQTGLFLTIWGAATGVATTILERLPTGEFEEGLYMAIVSAGLLQLFKGASMLLLWNRLRPAFEGGSPGKTAERLRMAKAGQLNQLERIIEFSLIAIGLVLSLLGSIGNWSPYYLALGIGLMIQSAVLFVTNLFTGFRQSLYHHYLER